MSAPAHMQLVSVLFSVETSLKMEMHQYLTLRLNMNRTIYHKTKTFRVSSEFKKTDHVKF